MTSPLIWPAKNSALAQPRVTMSLCTSAVMQASAIRPSVWKDISALFSPLSFQNNLSEPRGRAQAHHNVSLPCLSTAAVRSTTVPQKYLKLHSCYTVGELYDFFFSFFKAQICTKKRAEGSQGLKAIQRLCAYSGGKKQCNNMCAS